MPNYSQAGQFGPAAIPGAPIGPQLRVVAAGGADATLFTDPSKNRVRSPYIRLRDDGTATFYADPGTYTVQWSGGSASVTVAGGTVDSSNLSATGGTLLSSALDVGEESMGREFINSVAVGGSSGQLRLCYFTARKTETTTQVRMNTGSTAAGATPTLCRIGLYLIAANGDATLVAATANDTTLFAATATPYTRSWSTPYQKVAGQRYAVSPLVVSGAAMPTFAGASISSSAEAFVSPALSSILSSQTDLPASIAAASLAANGNRLYAAILP